VDTDHKITMDLEWKAPEQTFGPLKGYRQEKDTLHQKFGRGVKTCLQQFRDF
jgi:hypothetical protein